MDESPTQSPQPKSNANNPSPDIPVEIITHEEMALIEAALASAAAAAATSSPSLLFPSPSRFCKSLRSVENAVTLLSSNCSLSRCSSTDLEDVGKGSFGILNGKEKEEIKNGGVNESLLNRFRMNRGLSVTDLTAAEWCEKQLEFDLVLGKPEKTEAMKAGSARHAALEEEVVKKVKVEVKSKEDVWALKFMNFVIGVNQLVFDGMTRELPLIGFAEGVWIIGVIDEIRMSKTEAERFPTLVDTKTRVRATLPAEPQRRNGRLQLMCYKQLWDSLVADKFPSGQFFDFFSLNPEAILSAEIRENTAQSGFPAETLDDLVKYYRNTCCTLPPANNQLLLRYELQEDQSLIGEDQFAYNPAWLKYQIKRCLEFWMGEREAHYVAEEERWKCRFCKFTSVCPAATDGTPS